MKRYGQLLLVSPILLMVVFVTSCSGGSAEKGMVAENKAADPLPSWNEGTSKKAIVGFVGSVTTEGSSSFVKPEDRIATFDNDGTLWAEQPMYFQFLFAIDRIKAMAPQHPEWKTKEP